VCSPPYWGLRDYFSSDETQLGLEKTPDLFVNHLVGIFREVRKVLHPTGVLWIVIDDTYCVPSTKRERELEMKPGVPEKNLIGVPWKLAFALQKDGWWLRCDVIWNATNKMPEPMKDRPSRKHEYIFMLTKKSHYFYDDLAIQEKIKAGNHFAGDRSKVPRDSGGMSQSGHSIKKELLGKTRTSVWNIPIEATDDGHHAAFPSKLVSLCVKSSTSRKGCCAKCFAPIVPIVSDYRTTGSYETPREIIGWEPSCDCGAEPIPCTVLDPFAGRGTTLMMAEKLGRRWIGIEVTKEASEIIRQNMITRKFGLKPITEPTNGLLSKEEIELEIK
jgi:DNA modification methylase